MRITRLCCVAFAIALVCATSSAQETRKAIAKPTPVYPEIARRMNLSGAVKVEITVGPDGEIKHANVIGGHPVLVNAALDALKKWKYEPAKTESIVNVTFDFHP